VKGLRQIKFSTRYGIDAPFWVAFLIIIGLLFTIPNIIGIANNVYGLIYGIICLFIGLWMFIYSTVIKLFHSDVMLELAKAKHGDELLDVGTGRGLLAISAAKRGCQVTATDIWSKWDLGGNEKTKLQSNMLMEGVSQVDILNADVRELPFQDENFDVVVSNFVIHNIKGAKERQKAVLEMWRVLRPNGTLVISDISKTTEYATVLKATSSEVKVKRFLYTFPFSKAVIVQKR